MRYTAAASTTIFPIIVYNHLPVSLSTPNPQTIQSKLFKPLAASAPEYQIQCCIIRNKQIFPNDCEQACQPLNTRPPIAQLNRSNHYSTATPQQSPQQLPSPKNKGNAMSALQHPITKAPNQSNLNSSPPTNQTIGHRASQPSATFTLVRQSGPLVVSRLVFSADLMLHRTDRLGRLFSGRGVSPPTTAIRRVNLGLRTALQNVITVPRSRCSLGTHFDGGGSFSAS